MNLEEVRNLFCKTVADSLCLSGWEAHKQKCYKFSKEKKNWKESKQECEFLNSRLIIINTPEDQKFAEKFHKQYPCWIGLTDQENEGNWTWVDGTPLSFSQWLDGEPNNAGDEDCAVLKSGRWNDRKCNYLFHFICQQRALRCIKAAATDNVCF
ncbi:CD209 antigen-like protein D [Scyliorhinus torazame]|uniref:CD209 antigen-like protein D n=1 Tax=Scyliorhinus torazame TaxID=75743 RepID=UPI003B5B309C